MEDKDENAGFPIPLMISRKYRNPFGNGWLRPNRVKPVPVYHSQEPRRSLARHYSTWDLFNAWIKYHSIQIRWDIERTLARLLGKRWGA
jgi:hypothetical protein